VIVECIRIRIAELSFYTTQRTQSFHTTISIGISCAAETIYAYELLYKHADLALYEAKQSGRNLVITYSGNATPQEDVADS
jgi:diguanylate cyclase (GGDEF)-like protein